jgi:hypothetical protein
MTGSEPKSNPLDFPLTTGAPDKKIPRLFLENFLSFWVVRQKRPVRIGPSCI